ncbi:hypothetical protein GCM10011351_05010 [Paraliobacillus quinghaiensis]|uniref:Uncharacterized protein n=1 Tax=Paraliobacillus quinghaiensis TaxID=470815 RepID=A0A917TH40_9BACI|nr:hypothetical protein [Paraliobacillus quinghaiensis]GGM22134.1 hypothetical protein GCM10011351_05010 [Paraliobacillus quinghaiensis]
MKFENEHLNNEELQTKDMYNQCNHYMHHHVLLNNKDGSSIDGIIVDVDVTNITVLVGEDLVEDEMDYRYGSYGGGYYNRPPRRRFRRYRPRRFPLAGLAALSLFPYAFGYPGYNPYPYPPYPYY